MTRAWASDTALSDAEILAAIEAIDVEKLQSLAARALEKAFSQTAVAVVGPQAGDRIKASTIEKLLGSYHWKPKKWR